MYQIKLSGRAKKELKRLDKRFESKITININLLKTNPFIGEKMIGGFQGFYRIKISPIRIIYRVDYQNRIIIVEAIGHRQGIYK